MIRIATGGEDRGEFAEEEAHRLIAEGKIDASAFYWRDGMTEWRPVAELVAPSPPPLPVEDLAGVGRTERPLTDEYHEAQIAVARDKLARLKQSPETFPEEIEEANEELKDAIEARKDRKEERDGEIQDWADRFHKDSIEEGLSEDLEPYLKIYKKPTKAQIRAMTDHCERVLDTTLTDQADEFFSLYEKLFPDARKAPKSPAQAKQPGAQRRATKSKKSGCFGLLVAATATALALALIAITLS